jgi:cytochrome c553
MTRTTLLLILASGAIVPSLTAQAADPVAGKQKYEATCAACHGTTGISIAPIYPNLAGQKAEYLIGQMKAFRDGTRQNPIMAPMAKGLTDTDIANISEFVATLKP